MKKWIINKYYYFLIWLEDIIGGISMKIHNHREKIDIKYWDKYLS